ncbi:MAG: hypothetical protein ACYS6K_07300 [Planctomycetota bacterium]
MAVSRPVAPAGTSQGIRSVPSQQIPGRPDHTTGVDQATVAAVADRGFFANDRARAHLSQSAAYQDEVANAGAADPDVVVRINGHMTCAAGDAAVVHVVDNTLIVGHRSVTAEPGLYVAEPRGRVAYPVVIAVLPLAVFFQSNVYDGTRAVAVGDPHASVLVHSGSRRISGSVGVRCRLVLSQYGAGKRVNLDNRPFAGNGHPDEIKGRCRVVDLQLVARVVDDIDQHALVEVGICCVCSGTYRSDTEERCSHKSYRNHR